MIACTSPAGTASDTPLRIGLSATVAWRFSMLSIRGPARWDLRLFADSEIGQILCGERKLVSFLELSVQIGAAAHRAGNGGKKVPLSAVQCAGSERAATFRDLPGHPTPDA